MFKFRRKVYGYGADFKETIVCKKGTLSATTVAMYGIANPLGVDLIITKVIVDITTKLSANVTCDIGCAAADATTSDDNLMDGVAFGTPAAAAVYNSADEAGTNGANARKWESDKYFTITASGTPTGAVGSVYIYYRKA